MAREAAGKRQTGFSFSFTFTNTTSAAATGQKLDLWRCNTEVHMRPDRKLWIVYIVRVWLVVCVCVRALCVDPVDDLFGLVNLALNQQQL